MVIFMKSIKPGRGPSFMEGFASVFVGLFGVVWIGIASSMGAPSFFVLFGVIFILLAIGRAIYNFSNATRKNRFSEYDITSESEEPDPLNHHYSDAQHSQSDSGNWNFCPYCGEKANEEYRYCRKCGKDIKDDAN